MPTDGHKPSVLAYDAGGTMTDAFIVDQDGGFVVGKALSTAHNESIGAIDAFRDGLKLWDRTIEAGAQSLKAIIYSGTAILNRVLTRDGVSPLGVIVTAGFEDTLRFERGIQVWLGMSYSDRLHSATHHHNEPIVPRHLVKGVRERIDVFGQVVAPLYEDEARQAVEDLVEEGVKAICVCFHFSFRNTSHEERMLEIAQEVLSGHGLGIPVLISSRHNPVRGEFPRLQTMILEAYAASPGRFHLQAVHQALKEAGSKAPMRVFTCYGGSIPITHEWMVSTMISGPIGGINGAKYTAEVMGLENVVCSDVGGTSFDVGLLTEGRFALDVEPAIGKMKLALPSIVLDSVGAGTGMYVRLDPVIKRIELGPGSAGAGIGMCLEEKTPTLNDCNLVLGYINPDYFLGGDVPLDEEKARNGLEEQISGPLGISVEEAAWGVVDLIHSQMRDHLYAMILGRGFSPENYSVFSYGGAGPLHLCGYAEGLGFEGAYVPTWAPAFSAFGCACSDYAFRYDRQLDFPLSPGLDEAGALAEALNTTWEALKNKVEQEMAKEGLPADHMEFQTRLRLQYQGQLDDLEISSPAFPLTPRDVSRIVSGFDQVYERVFPTASKSPELGYLITRAVALGVLPTERPRIQEYPLGDAHPPDSAKKGQRPIYWKGEWSEATLYEMDSLTPGNEIAGPTVIEAPATTFLLPPGFRTVLNKYKIFEIPTG